MVPFALAKVVKKILFAWKFLTQSIRIMKNWKVP